MVSFELSMLMAIWFLLQLALPFVIILVFGYGLNRLVDYLNGFIEP